MQFTYFRFPLSGGLKSTDHQRYVPLAVHERSYLNWFSTLYSVQMADIYHAAENINIRLQHNYRKDCEGSCFTCQDCHSRCYRVVQPCGAVSWNFVQNTACHIRISA